MIVIKPRLNTFFSIGVFLLLSYGSAVFLLINILSVEESSIWKYVLLGFVLIVALIITFKMLGSYKKVIIDKKRADVFSIFGLVKKRLYFKDMKTWKEEKVKTGNGIFKQLDVRFSNKQHFRIANQEHENYEKAAIFFRKHFKKLEEKASS